MNEDPNNVRWSKSNSFGKEVLRKSGWIEGDGLGKGQDGIKTAVKVSKKDDVTGIGYQAGVKDTWSAQSVGFADVLDRIKGKKESKVKAAAGSDEDHQASVSSSPLPRTSTSPVGSKYTAMYAKRHALKTEGLQASQEGSKAEILGEAYGKRVRDSSSHDPSVLTSETESSLKSPTLRRLMLRVPTEEPKPRSKESLEATVQIVKPTPRPPKCTETPFLSHEKYKAS